MRKLFILFFALLVVSQDASATYNTDHRQYRYSETNAAYATWRDSALEACTDWANYAKANNPSINWTVDPNQSPRYPSFTCSLVGYDAYGGIAGSGSRDAFIRYLCKDGSATTTQGGNGSSSWGVCADSTDVPTGPVCNTAAGSTVTWTQKTGHSVSEAASTSDAGSRVAYPSSSPTCGITGVPSVVSCYSTAASGGGKDFYCTFSGVSNGANADAATAPVAGGSTAPADAKPATTSTSADSKGNCPGGTVQAGVDSSGIPVCVGAGTNPSQSSSSSTTKNPTTTTTAADGTTTSTSSTSTVNSDGSTTTTTVTTVTSPDGTVKTSTATNTSNAPNGAAGQNDDSKDFCSAHPELTICQNSSVAGSCGQVSCVGDAIQCATLRAAAAMQCAQQQDIDALKAMSAKALGDQIMAGNDPMAGQISDTLKGTTVDMSNASFDQSGFLAGGSCLANRSFTAMGQVITVDFSTVCNNIVPLRAVMMAVAVILAYLIVGRSVVGS